VLAFVRRRVPTREQAEDITQDFFAHIIGGEFLSRADERAGRFRSFLLHALRCFLADKHDFDRAKKRGGDQITLSIDNTELQPMQGLTPEAEFEQRWVRNLLRRSLAQLSEEYQGSRRRLFDLLSGQLDSDSRPQTQQIAEELGMTDGAARVALHRMKSRLGDLIRKEIADTLPQNCDIDDEIGQLRQILEQKG
jgi:RNA polymerase sigma-70 factor (ECF subfamily)